MGADTSPDQQYSLRWNDFHSSILSSFRHLRDEEDFVDVTLACDGCSFTAHKVVLSACSPYFRRLLKANPCSHPIVILRDVQQKDMESLLRFMYNGEVHIGQEHLTDFLKTAQMLQVRGLADVSAGAAGQRLTVPEKISPNSSSLPWATDRPDALRDGGALSPPPAKRSRSSDRVGGGVYTPDRHRSPSRGNGDMQESLLGQALEGGPTLHTKEKSDSSLQAQSTGEDSNSSDTAMSEHGDDGPNNNTKTEQSDYPMLDDHHPYNTNGGLMDQSRNPFPGALLGLQGLGGLMPGPSGMHNSPDNFVSRRSLDMMRVRATDPRPCPKCGKIYRSAHTLRTHLEDKHTICPGYRCVLCGTVAKSRNSLHSHMSRQHRGISTKDLPVLPMPAPFDPDLASKLLAKAGVKISPAELRARASPTGPRRSDVKLDAKSAYSGAVSEAGSSICGENDPEDLTMSHPRYGAFDFAMSPPNSFKPSRFAASAAVAAKSIDSLHNLSKEPYPAPLAPPAAAAANLIATSPLLDSYFQYMTENTLGMGMMSPEQAAAAMQVAKFAQLNAMGMDKGLQQQLFEKMQQMQNNADYSNLIKRNDEIRRGEAEMVNHDRDPKENDEGESSAGEEDEYSEDEMEPETAKAGE
ncbi:unnamed protein product [Brassicogethes aeneus]|uniref:Protein abrupt-like n=1 Tax=Brassicogethes aeneus TaxID=1431903 RepID=A0A9P0B942_BRAAE|nr:unnamed protein product [Brassicogethes aeneus]